MEHERNLLLVWRARDGHRVAVFRRPSTIPARGGIHAIGRRTVRRTHLIDRCRIVAVGLALRRQQHTYILHVLLRAVVQARTITAHTREITIVDARQISREMELERQAGKERVAEGMECRREGAKGMKLRPLENLSMEKQRV